MRIAPLPRHLAVATHQPALAGDPTQPGERRIGRHLARDERANDLIELLADYADPGDLTGPQVEGGACAEQPGAASPTIHVGSREQPFSRTR
ncbi:MAG TPA: hypothetical protein VK679_05550 [Gemmatimonadaceae bacterium]|nr:hypothetical protein [Gemmatimonadaceae bacterium]